MIINDRKILIFYAILLIGLVLQFSCDDKKKHQGKTPVARVYDKYLYKEDLAKVIPSGLSKEDSILKVKSYIDFWVKRYAMTKTAELNLAEEQKDVAEELENYRMDLLIFRYKQRFIEQNLDTIVTQKQITDFYQQHEKEFMLSQPAIKALFIKILKTSPNLSMIRNLYKSSREVDIKQVKDYCEEHSAHYNDYGDEWVYFKDIVIEIPTRIDDQELYLKTNTSIEAQDSAYLYLLNIKNYRLKDAISPINFVEGNIQSMILNQRKQELLNVIENNVYNSMIDKKDIELFENE
jgi:hypothetical protein